ncbi:uncharacterized protein VP01_2221g1 [Puccinia sorghi]|uniref:Uncharacterized protein n=1 Tax=Puccinia sorghi TaxID=27349 RepID=A0A0L6V9D3_9BASI|nr:uncharacterized protein VP01_2221g1 [Puccinia sorghi]
MMWMKAKLFELDAWDIVNGVAVKPEKTKEQSTWTKKNQLAYAEIIDHLNADNMAFVGGAMPETHEFDGQYFCNLLKSKYAADNNVAKFAALEMFLGIKYTSIGSFLSLIWAAKQKLILAGMDLGNKRKNLMALAKLPCDCFQSFRDVVAMGFSSETFESLLHRLENYSVQNKIAADKDQILEPEALLMTLTLDQFNFPHFQKPFKICSHCQKTGHTADSCY